MDWDWAVGGITDDIPRTTGPECINYMTNRRRWTEAVLLSALFAYIMYTSWKRLEPIKLPNITEIEKPHSTTRLTLLISMSVIFGIELGFKLASKSMLFVLNPCHVQTCVQIYLLAAKPSKFTIALFRIQMSNLNGPFLAFLFPEVEGRSYPFEQATYWIQHALLYIIPIYILKTGAYSIEDIGDFNWVKIGTAFMLFYHFTLLNGLSILTGINVDHMLCAAVSDPFQGQNYRIAACLHEALLCPLLNKCTVLLCRPKRDNIDNCCDKIMSTSNIPLNLNARDIIDSNDMIYHQIQQHQRAEQMQQLEQEYSTTAEMENVANSAESAALLRQRFNNTQGNDLYNGSNEITAITAEFPMPTTKID